LKSHRLSGATAALATSLVATLASSGAVANTAASPPASAASQPVAEVVVSASRTAEAAAASAFSTRVIDRAEIEATQAADLPTVLRSALSVDIAQSGPPGSLTSVFLRGADSRQVLLLVDGVPMNRADFGLAPWQSLPLAQIERIEVVRGNLSAVWGAAAVGGVVQVFTRGGAGEAPRTAWSATAGTQGRAGWSLNSGARWGTGPTATAFSGGFSANRTAGWDARVSGPHNLDRDGNRQLGGSLRLEQGWAPGHRTTLSALASDNKADYDDTFGSTTATDRLRTRLDALGVASRHAMPNGTELAVDGGRTRERFEDPTGYTRIGRNDVQQLQAQLQSPAALSAGRWTLALETRREQFSSSTDPDTRRQTDSARAGWNARYPLTATLPLELQAQARHDRSSAFGSASTGLLAAALVLNAQWRVSAQAATGFSLPSFIDQLYAAPGMSLKPERSRNAEAAVQWARGGDRLRLTVFEQHQRDRIGFDDNFAAVNIDRATNRGLELSGRTALPLGELGLDLTRQNPVNEDTGRALARRARENAVLSWRLSEGIWTTGLWWRHTGARFDSDFSDARSPSRRTLDAAVSMRLAANWSLGLRAENLGGTDVPEVRGYTAPPRAFSLTLRGSL
jgi:vitamin B12 transporter